MKSEVELKAEAFDICIEQLKEIKPNSFIPMFFGLEMTLVRLKVREYDRHQKDNNK